MPPRPLLVELLVGRRLAVSTISGDQVPLVDHDDDGASALVSVAGNCRIARGYAFHSVDQDERDIGGFEMLARHHDGELFGHQLGLALATDSGGVDEAVGLAGVLNEFVNRVASGPGEGQKGGATGAGGRVKKR